MNRAKNQAKNCWFRQKSNFPLTEGDLTRIQTFRKRDDLVRIIWTTLFRWLTPKVISTVTSCIFSHKSGFRISYQRKLKKLIRSLRDLNTPNRRVLPDKDPCDGLIALFLWFPAVNWAVLGGFKFEKGWKLIENEEKWGF